MEVARLELHRADYEQVQEHLRGGEDLDCEEAAFLFCQPRGDGDLLTLAPRDVWCLPPEAFASRCEFYLELSDQTRASIIKRAHDLEASVVEVHSHPQQVVAEFSWSDLYGFEEFVPHIRWRLKGRPYAAIVCTSTSFDSLVWIDSDEPAGCCSIVVDGEVMRPTSKSLAARGTGG